GNQWMLEWWLPKGRAPHTVTDEELLAWERDYTTECDATSENLDAFKVRGGKFIVSGGLEDSIVPVLPMADWFRRVNARYGGKETHTFCRFYLLPGWAHGPGRTMASCPDYSAALINWVEKGIAPESLPAKMRDGSTLQIAPQW
ncbi:MAG: tannase/feruloyl esterase family alpha/beta hydrolase, partial [Kiritimatiellae bacterium]|nr:tannase/feruloyl esterase family alpha/beta hydrolase [Kiritimatiellia bacterium]